MTTNNYDASSVKTLTSVEAFREKIGMYAGGAGLGLDDNTGIVKTFLEIIDNSADEAMNGHGNCIEVSVVIKTDPKSKKDYATYQVRDYGRGIPFDKMENGKSALEVLLSDLHAGGKHSSNSNYKTSGGTNGIGASLTNATSSHFQAKAYRQKKGLQISWKDGKKSQEKEITSPYNNGTEITWIPSLDAFTEADTNIIPFNKLSDLLRVRSFLNVGVKFTLSYKFQSNNITDQEDYFIEFKANSVADFIKYHVKNYCNDSLVKGTPLITYSDETTIKNRDGSQGSMSIDLAFSFTKQYDKGDSVWPFCNLISQLNGGTHLQGFKMGLPGPILKYIQANKTKYLVGPYKNIEPEGIDVNNSVIALINIKHTDPIYSSQDKSKLKNSDVQGLTHRATSHAIKTFLEDKANEKTIKEIINRILRNAKLRKASDTAKTKINKESEKLDSIGRAAKLADCTGKDKTELFLTEGKLSHYCPL